MKKYFNLLIIIITCLFIAPYTAFANSDSSGNAGGGYGGVSVCSTNCNLEIGLSQMLGVRFTFVDENGQGLSNSYDFLTQHNSKYTCTVNFNVYHGDKSKLTGGFSEGKKNVCNDMPKLSDLIVHYNGYTEPDENGVPVGVTPHNVPTSGWTSGMYRDSQPYGKIVSWFTGMTKTGNPRYRINVNGFLEALSKVYPEFNADAFKLKLQEGCRDGTNIFIQMEPLLYWGGKKNGFGTLRDLIQIFPQKLSAKLSTFTLDKVYSAIHYDHDLQQVEFKGYSPYYKGYKITSDAQMNDKVGYGAALDWANDSSQYCNQCDFKVDEQQMYYNDELVSEYKAPYTNLYEYTLASEEPGLNCCNALDDAKKDKKLNEEWEEYYDYYCNLIGDPCTIREFKNLGKTLYFCPNGKDCSKDEYEEQCGPICEEEPEPDPDDPGGGGPSDSCCTLDPIEPGWIDGEVHNCCGDGTTSKAHEYDLDELFCDNEYLGVSNYQYKCGADYYAEPEENLDLDSDYCRMYCTERVSVEIPGSISAISGRYFKLTSTSHGTTSSYIEGYKRCRVRIRYDAWEQDYYDTVEEEVEAYNQFQEDKAYQRLYEQAEKDVISGQKETSNITCGCTCTYTYNTTCGSGKNTYSCTKTATASASDSDTCDIEFNKYPFKKMFDIYPVKIDETKRNTCNENIFEAIEFTEDKSYKTEHNDWSSWEIDPSIAKCNQQTTSMQKTVSAGGKCTCTLACGRTTTEAESRREDVHTVRQDYNDAADADNEAYNGAADRAKNLEETIDVCDKYFTEYAGADGPSNYEFDASQSFYYTQVYLDDYRHLQMDSIYVNFEEDPGCVVDAKPTLGPDSSEDKLADKQYSTNKYGTGTENMTDFKNTLLDYEKTATGYKKYQDTMYPADKIFTHDAKYHVTCSWKEGDNTLYTLVPSGSASEETSEINYTEHGQEYHVYLSTLEGTYETYWDISGLGSPRKGSSEGRFDQYFRDAGRTCSNENPNYSTMLTCKIHSEHEIVLTGYCNGSNGTDTTNRPDDCDPYEEGYRLFNFKVVDPKNLFPSGVNTVDGSIAWNWTTANKGRDALQKIQAVAERGMTYSPETLSYSFVLTPTDMGHIKNYNAQQVMDEMGNSAGGYSDFTLQCSTQSCNEGLCKKCMSTFLENLANGKVVYSKTSHDVTGWGNINKDLTAVRNSLSWD